MRDDEEFEDRIGSTADVAFEPADAPMMRHAMVLADVIDRLSAGVILIRADGQIMHANARAQAVLSAGDLLHAVGGRLTAADPDVNRALRQAPLDALSDAAASGVVLPLRAHDGTPHIIHVLPLRTEVRRAGGGAPVLAVFIAQAAFEALSSPEIIGRAFNLTRTELRVLLAIVDVGGVPEVAAALGVADSTVKTHVGRLFEKTGATRQADLVKLVAAFSHRLVA